MPDLRVDKINCKHFLGDRDIVPEEQVHLFCKILFFVANHGEGWQTEDERKVYANRTRLDINKLKWPLSKPHRLLRRTLLPDEAETTHLCVVHKALNADFVHQWFKCLALEVGARLEILRWGGRDFLGQFAWDNIIFPLTRIQSIWLSSEQMQESFGHLDRPENIKAGTMDATLQKDGCEACILARIASHKNTVVALYSIVKSRMSFESHAKRPHRLRLLRLIEPWLAMHDGPYSGDADKEYRKHHRHSASVGMAEELYEKRKELEVHRHRQRRAERKLLDSHLSGSDEYKKMVSNLENANVEDEIDDAENDIIDHYAALRDTKSALGMLSDIPASREQVQISCLGSNLNDEPIDRSGTLSTTRKSIHEPSPYVQSTYMQARLSKTYTASRYSLATVENNERIISGPSAAWADITCPESMPHRYSLVKNPYAARLDDGGSDSEMTSNRNATLVALEGGHSTANALSSSGLHRSQTVAAPERRSGRVLSSASSNTMWPAVQDGSRVNLRYPTEQDPRRICRVRSTRSHHEPKSDEVNHYALARAGWKLQKDSGTGASHAHAWDTSQSSKYRDSHKERRHYGSGKTEDN